MVKHDFIKFLRREKVLTKFQKNLKNPKINGSTEQFKTIEEMTKGNPELFISGSFNFKKSPEGHDFWWNITEKWRKHLSYIIEQTDEKIPEDKKDPDNKPTFRKYPDDFEKEI